MLLSVYNLKCAVSFHPSILTRQSQGKHFLSLLPFPPSLELFLCSYIVQMQWLGLCCSSAKLKTQHMPHWWLRDKLSFGIGGSLTEQKCILSPVLQTHERWHTEHFSYLHSMGKWQYPEDDGWRNRSRRTEERRGGRRMTEGEKTKISLSRKRKATMVLLSPTHSYLWGYWGSTRWRDSVCGPRGCVCVCVCACVCVFF